MKNIKKLFISKNNTIKEVMKIIQEGGVGIAILLDDDGKLKSTITDGDIRRAILNNVLLNTKILRLVEDKSFNHLKPTTVSIGTSHKEILKLMNKKVLQHIPAVNDKGNVVELICLSEIVEEELQIPISAVVMAGGRGQRLKKFTKNTPKPMLPLEDRPLMERTIEQLKKAGITKVNISTHYKSKDIINYFGNGYGFDVEINYINEDQPLGTAGALGLLECPNNTTIVVNGDVLTQLDFKAMLSFHRSHKAIMTVGVRKCDFKIPYGVININDVDIKRIVEKPTQTFIINAGVYLLEPVAYRYIPKNNHFDMTELVNCLIKENHKVICFPIQEYWLDVGNPITYEQAKEDIKKGCFS